VVHATRAAFLALVPARGNLCSVSVGGDQAVAGCTPDDLATRNGLVQFGTDPPSGGTGSYVEGALPDGAHDVSVTTNRRQRRIVALNEDNAFFVSSAQPLQTLIWSARDGRHHRVDIAIASASSP
jgi:hypothetical protein